MTAGKKCRVIHDLITRKMWLLKNDIFENSSLSIQTHLINKCTVLLHLTYSQGLLGVINHVVNSLKIKIIGTPYTAGLSLFILFCCNLCCFDALYAVLLQYVLLFSNSCSFFTILLQFTLFCRDDMNVAKYALSQAL